MPYVNRLFFLAFVGLSISLPLKAGVYHPKTHTLSNGLEVIVIENHRAPLVMHMMVFKVGTNDSPWGKSGLAHYLEHLMFKGTSSSAAGKIMQEVTRIGGNLNAQTTSDYTLYYEIVPSVHLETVMKLDAERMASLDIRDEWAKPEISVILEERHMRIDNTVMGKFREELDALDIRHHPSRFPTIGWEHEIKNYTTQDAQDFYRKYAPNNAFIILAGSIEFDKARQLAEKYYGSIPVKNIPSPLNIQEPKGYDIPQSFEMTSEIIENPVYIARYPAPTFNEGEKKKFYALVILENLLGRSVTGRLTESLVEKQHLAAQLSVDYMGLQSGPGRFQIIMAPGQDIVLSKLEQKLAEELAKLAQEGVTAKEVEDTKNYILAELVYTRDNIIKSSQNLASLYASGMPLEEIEAWPEAIKAVTLNQINEIAREIFASPQCVVGRLIPKNSKQERADTQ